VPIVFFLHVVKYERRIILKPTQGGIIRHSLWITSNPKRMKKKAINIIFQGERPSCFVVVVDGFSPTHNGPFF
jgi:hypothetical protein